MPAGWAGKQCMACRSRPQPTRGPPTRPTLSLLAPPFLGKQVGRALPTLLVCWSETCQRCTRYMRAAPEPGATGPGVKHAACNTCLANPKLLALLVSTLNTHLHSPPKMYTRLQVQRGCQQQLLQRPARWCGLGSQLAWGQAPTCVPLATSPSHCQLGYDCVLQRPQLL